MISPSAPDESPAVLGWREWITLPDLEVPWVKAKLDTGARSSSLHAVDLTYHKAGGCDYVEFSVRPWQRSNADSVRCKAPLRGYRQVQSSSGHKEDRPLIVTTLRLHDLQVQAELTLTDRRQMGFRMLVGREAIRGVALVDPGKSFYSGRPPLAVRKANRRRGS